MGLMKYNINTAKSHFFTGTIVKDLDRNAKKGLSRFGAIVRRAAKSKLRKARQKKISELTRQELQRFRIQQEIAKREGLPKPKRPLAPSAPGEPPRMIGGQIKKFLYFAYDPGKRSVVIGPAQLDRPTGAPGTLEQGGWVRTNRGRARIAQRPYMKPSFDKEIGKLPRLLAGKS